MCRKLLLIHRCQLLLTMDVCKKKYGSNSAKCTVINEVLTVFQKV